MYPYPHGHGTPRRRWTLFRSPRRERDEGRFSSNLEIGSIVAGAHAFRGGSAPKGPCMRPQDAPLGTQHHRRSAGLTLGTPLPRCNARDGVCAMAELASCTSPRTETHGGCGGGPARPRLPLHLPSPSPSPTPTKAAAAAAAARVATACPSEDKHFPRARMVRLRGERVARLPAGGGALDGAQSARSWARGASSRTRWGWAIARPRGFRPPLAA
jgi:hypothetical protein